MEAKSGSGTATAALDGFRVGAEALAAAAAQLELARAEVERAEGPATKAELLAEEIADVLVRVKAERELLSSKLPRS